MSPFHKLEPLLVARDKFSAPLTGNLMGGCTCRLFIPVCTGSGSGMQNPSGSTIHYVMTKLIFLAAITPVFSVI